MKLAESLKWFKTTFHSKLQAAVTGTPYTVDLLTAIAQQETGYIWSRLVDKGKPLDEIFKLCTGDTIDAKFNAAGKNVGRSAFPKNKAELVAYPQGQEMFQIAREALESVASATARLSGSSLQQNQVLPWLRHLPV